MSVTETTKGLQRFLDESCVQFSRGDGPAAKRTVALLGTIDANIAGSRTSALTAEETSAAVPEEIEELLHPSSETACLAAVRATYRSLQWYRSGRSGMPYTQVVGPGSLIAHDEIRVGLFLLTRASVYPDHLHGADEVYIVLAGSGEWSLDRCAYEKKVAGDIIEVPPMTVHALRSKAEPAVVLWSWTGDITMNRYSFA